jgi:hypothetical protein
LQSNLLKGSKLKPDAPEFIPLTPKSGGNPSKTDAKNAAKEQKKLEKQEKQEKEQQKKQRKAASSMGKKFGKGLGRHDGADGLLL